MGTRIRTGGFLLLLLLMSPGWASCSTSQPSATGDVAPEQDAVPVDGARDGAVDAGGAVDGGVRPDSAVAWDVGSSGSGRDARVDGHTAPACPSDGECGVDAAAPAECPGNFTEQPGACPSGWTCISPDNHPALLCGVETLRASDCEDIGGIVVPDIGDGSTRCLEGTYLGGVSYGIEGALCCARSRIDCGACRPAASGSFGCDGATEQMWECNVGEVPDVLPLLCRDLLTALPRYCCSAQGAPVCAEGT